MITTLYLCSSPILELASFTHNFMLNFFEDLESESAVDSERSSNWSLSRPNSS